MLTSLPDLHPPTLYSKDAKQKNKNIYYNYDLQ